MIRYKNKLSVLDVEDFRSSVFWSKLMDPDIHFIRVPHKGIVILERSIGAMSLRGR